MILEITIKPLPLRIHFLKVLYRALRDLETQINPWAVKRGPRTYGRWPEPKRPKAGAFFRLRSPQGEIFEGRNIRKFVRDNAHLFGQKDDLVRVGHYLSAARAFNWRGWARLDEEP